VEDVEGAGEEAAGEQGFVADRGALGRPNHLHRGGLGGLRGLWDRGPHL